MSSKKCADEIFEGELDASLEAELKSYLKELEGTIKEMHSVDGTNITKNIDATFEAKKMISRMQRKALDNYNLKVKANENASIVMKDAKSGKDIIKNIKTLFNDAGGTSANDIMVSTLREEHGIFYKHMVDTGLDAKWIESLDVEKSKQVMIAVGDLLDGAEISVELPPADIAQIKGLKETLLRYNESDLKNKKNSGVYIDRADGYIGYKQSDANKLNASKGSRARAADLLKANLSERYKSSAGITTDAQLDKHVNALVSKIINGETAAVSDVDTITESAFKAAGTTSRTLEFKSKKAEIEYYSEFGNLDDVPKWISSMLSRNSNTHATQLSFGGDPLKAKKLFMSKLKWDKAVGEGQDIKSLRKQAENLWDDYIDRVYNSATNIPSTMVSLLNTVKNVNLGKLGSVIKTATSADFNQALYVGNILSNNPGVMDQLNRSATLVKDYMTTAFVGLTDKEKFAAAKIFHNELLLFARNTNITRFGEDGVTAKGVSGKLEDWSRKGANLALGITGINQHTTVASMAANMDSLRRMTNTLELFGKGDTRKKVQFNMDLFKFTAEESKLMQEISSTANFNKYINEDVGAFDINAFMEDQDFSKYYKYESIAAQRKEAIRRKLQAATSSTKTAGVTQISPFENVSNSRDGGIKGAVIKLLTAFKPTMIAQTMDNINLADKLNRAGLGSHLGAAAGGYMVSSAVSYLAIDFLMAQVLNSKSSLEKMMGTDEEKKDAIIDWQSKTSLAPAITDPIMSVVGAKRKYGRSGMENFFSGPIGQTTTDFAKAVKSKDPGANLLTAGAKFFGAGISSNILIKGASRHLFDKNPTYDFKKEKFRDIKRGDKAWWRD